MNVIVSGGGLIRLSSDYFLQKSLKKHLKSPCKCVIIFRGHFTSRCFCDIITVVLQPCKKSKIDFDFVIVGFLLFFYINDLAVNVRNFARLTL